MGNIKKKLIVIYEKIYPVLRNIYFSIKYKYKIMSFKETITYIKDKECSIVRYGDGEFGLILQSNNPAFQSYDKDLSNRLKEIADTNDQRVLVCLPRTLKTTRYCGTFAKKYWEEWKWQDNKIFKIAKMLQWNTKTKKVYGDSLISRPYMDYKNKKGAYQRFEALKSLWNGRNVLIIEGERTRLGVGNNLFENTQSIERVICPSKNAFSIYRDIYDDVVSILNERKDALILIALGPTATVLAYDLALAGYQALDIGHIDMEYEWFLGKEQKKVVVVGKDSWEGGLNQIEDLMIEQNEEYFAQIIKRIG